MSIRRFATKDAVYTLQLGNHLLRNRHPPFVGLDALVLEGAGIERSVRKPDRQYENLVRDAQASRTPLFTVDCHNTYGFLSGFLQPEVLAVGLVPYAFQSSWYGVIATSAAVGVAFLALTQTDKQWTHPYFRGLAGVNLCMQSPMVAARDAIGATKIRTVVVPEIRRRTGKETPHIGIVYGAGHAGMEWHLKHPWISHATLWNHRQLNYRSFAGLRNEQIPLIEEYDWDTGCTVQSNSTLSDLRA